MNHGGVTEREVAGLARGGSSTMAVESRPLEDLLAVLIKEPPPMKLRPDQHGPLRESNGVWIPTVVHVVCAACHRSSAVNVSGGWNFGRHPWQGMASGKCHHEDCGAVMAIWACGENEGRSSIYVHPEPTPFHQPRPELVDIDEEGWPAVWNYYDNAIRNLNMDRPGPACHDCRIVVEEAFKILHPELVEFSQASREELLQRDGGMDAILLQAAGTIRRASGPPAHDPELGRQYASRVVRLTEQFLEWAFVWPKVMSEVDEVVKGMRPKKIPKKPR